jgi:hypothetical protein
MLKHIATGLLLAGMVAASSQCFAGQACEPLTPDHVAGMVGYPQVDNAMPIMDIVGTGPVQMYSAPVRGCEIPEAVIPSHLKGVVSADAAHNGWAYVYFPVPGDVATYAGWIDARRIAFSKHQPSADLPVYDEEVDKVFTRSRISGPNS